MQSGTYTYAVIVNGSVSNGDSGGPVYTAPNSDDEVEFVGMISSGGNNNGKDIVAVTPWHKIQKFRFTTHFLIFLNCLKEIMPCPISSPLDCHIQHAQAINPPFYKPSPS